MFVGVHPVKRQPGQTPPDEWQERTQRLWWYLLFAGILLLTAETWLAERLMLLNAAVVLTIGLGLAGATLLLRRRGR